MLTVSRKEVQKMHAHFVTVSKEDKGLNFTDGVVCALEELFGSKGLPDEPLFQILAENCNSENHISKSDNKPTEATENANLSQETTNCDKRFDNILKDSFSKERRLNTAAIVLAGIVAGEAPARHPVKRALELTDALIAECKKGAES